MRPEVKTKALFALLHITGAFPLKQSPTSISLIIAFLLSTPSVKSINLTILVAPIVTSYHYPIELLSAFVDSHLQSIAQSLFSYIKHTNHFLIILHSSPTLLLSIPYLLVLIHQHPSYHLPLYP